MHTLSVLKIVGALLVVIGLAMLVPAWASAVEGQSDWPVFLVSGAAIAVLGVLLRLVSLRAGEISVREGFVAVTAAWVAACAGGALPFYFTGAAATVTDAIFESMAGFTTTSATTISDYDGLGHGILLWRSLSQWMGGMGVILLALAVLPALGIGGLQIYRREIPGLSSDQLMPRIRDTAKALWFVYVILTLLETVVLYALGMSPFEAVNHAMTTIATGGFSTRPDSIAGFQSVAIEWTVIAFMFVAGMNFSLHYRLIARPGRRLEYLRNIEWRWYVLTVALASLALVATLFFRQGYPLGEALTKGTFQVVSIITTTGFTTDDYVRWGAFPQLLLLALMIAGGCAGSTSGGLKWVRILLVFKNIRLELIRLVHPHAVLQARINHTVVTQEVQRTIYTFLFLFFTTLAALTVLISLDGHSIVTSLGAAASALANVGPGLESLGPAESHAPLSDYVKWVLILAMLLGRLELMTLFVAVFPFLWRR